LEALVKHVHRYGNRIRRKTPTALHSTVSTLH